MTIVTRGGYLRLLNHLLIVKLRVTHVSTVDGAAHLASSLTHFSLFGLIGKLATW